MFSTQANMWPSYAPLTSHEDDTLLGEPSAAEEKTQEREGSGFQPYALYIFLAIVLILNLATFAKTLTMQGETLSAITQARDIDRLPRPDPYVGLPSQHCKFLSTCSIQRAEGVMGHELGRR